MSAVSAGVSKEEKTDVTSEDATAEVWKTTNSVWRTELASRLGYSMSSPLTPVPTASVSYSYTGVSTAGFLPLSGAPMPAAFTASFLVWGFAPNNDFTLQYIAG